MKLTQIFLIALLITLPLQAQDITNKLGGDTATETYDVTDSGDNLLFRVQGDNGILFNGTFGTGTIPIEGPGTRMMWYPAKSAFRVGTISSGNTQWNDGNIGNYSTAMGYETKAGGNYSTAIGYQTSASGDYSTAMGISTTASGESSTAMGHGIEASGVTSIAIALDDQTGTVVTQNNTMAIMGGNVGIGTIAPEATLDVHGTVKAFGTFVRMNNGPHEALTDGFVICFLPGGNESAGIVGYTDSNANPITVVQNARVYDGGGIVNIVMPVKKGNYWRLSTVSYSGSSPIITWIPLGQ